MKFKNFTLNIAITYLLLLTSSAAMAAGCGDGRLENEDFDGSLIVDDVISCVIISSTIEGNIIIRDTANVLLLNNTVGGRIRVLRTDGQEGFGVANVIANTVFTGNLAVTEYGTVNVIENETLSGNIRVNGNTDALAQKNIAAGDIICRGNTVLRSFFNFAGGTVDCE